MLLRKIIILSMLCFVSYNSFAADSIWKKSYTLEIKGKYEQANNVLKPAISKNNEFALIRSAYLHYMQAKYSDAITLYKKAIQLYPESIDAKLGITLPLMAQKRWRQVKSYNQKVIEMSKWNYTAHVRLMITEEATRNWDDLIEHASQLAKVYPSDATILVYLARGYAWKGDVDAAKSAYEKVLMRFTYHFEAKSYLVKNK